MESWITRYLRFTEKHEAPEMFHLWVAITVLSAAMGRRSYIDRGYYRLYPNFFTVLVAGSARCRKSTAINIGARLLADASVSRIIAGKTSTERFLKDLQWVSPEDVDAPAVLLHEDELSVFLTRDSHGDKLIDVLTKLFDCPDLYQYKTFSHGTVDLRDVYISILAGTTPDSLKRCLPDAAFGGGFTSRMMIVSQDDTTRRNAFPELSDEERQLRQELVDDLQDVSKASRENFLTPEGKAFFEEWYSKQELPEDKMMDGYFGRKHDHVLRLAMVIGAAFKTEGKVDERTLKAAIGFLEAAEYQAPSALKRIGAGVHSDHLDRVSRQMMRFKRISHSDLLRKNYHYLDAAGFREVMDTLIQAGFVARDPEKSHFYVWKGPQRPPSEPEP